MKLRQPTHQQDQLDSSRPLEHPFRMQLVQKWSGSMENVLQNLLLSTLKHSFLFFDSQGGSHESLKP